MSAFAGLRVLDLSGTVATAYCAKLFADFGAEVIQVEPPEHGAPVRGLEPTIASAPPAEASALSAWLSAGKRSRVLDLADPRDLETALALGAGADVVIEGERPGALSALGCGAADIQAAGSRAIVCSITWFGQTGPWAHWHGSDGVVSALAGAVRNFGPAEGPPLFASGYPVQILGGLTAFVAIVACLIGRERRVEAGEPSCLVHLDTSLYESALCLTEPGAVAAYNWQEGDPAPLRLGINRFWPTFPASIYRAADGWIGVTALTPAQWRSLCELIGLPELAADPRYVLAADRHGAADELDATLGRAFRERSAEYWFHEGQARRLPLALVPTPEELLRCPQFGERGAFATVEHRDLGTFQGPGVPFRLHGTPARPGGAAPRLGSSSDGWTRRTGEREAPLPPRSPTAGRDVRGPLDGLRVVDLSMGWAGPLAARHLADLGADVIKIESCRHFDWWRGWEVTEQTLADNLLERAWPYNTVNRNKRGVTLDLTTATGARLLKRLVGLADACLENFAGSVMPKLGLGRDVLLAENANLVMLSMPPFGASGDWRHYRAYGSTVEQASGLPHLEGEANWPPTMQHVALGDPVAGLNGAAGLLVALFHRARTGRGQSLDLSHVESLFPLGAHGVIEQSLLGQPPTRRGSRHRYFAPHGVFRCAGEDQWVAITVTKDSQWQGLCAVIGPDLAADPRFKSAQLRKRNEDALAVEIERWTRGRSKREAMVALQDAGVPAGAVAHGADLLADPQHEAREFWQYLDRRHCGLQPNPSAGYRRGDRPIRVMTPAPTLGEHNEEVLRDLLGLSAEEVSELRATGVIGTYPTLPST